FAPPFLQSSPGTAAVPSSCAAVMLSIACAAATRGASTSGNESADVGSWSEATAAAPSMAGGASSAAVRVASGWNDSGDTSRSRASGSPLPAGPTSAAPSSVPPFLILHSFAPPFLQSSPGGAASDASAWSDASVTSGSSKLTDATASLGRGSTSAAVSSATCAEENGRASSTGACEPAGPAASTTAETSTRHP